MLTFCQAMLPIAVKAGLAVAAEAGGVVGTEGVRGAPAVVALAGFLVVPVVGEDCKVKQTCMLGTGRIGGCQAPARACLVTLVDPRMHMWGRTGKRQESPSAGENRRDSRGEQLRFLLLSAAAEAAAPWFAGSRKEANH